MRMPELKGISHVELTVSDSDQAAIWWQHVMGFVVVRQFRGESFEGRVMVHRLRTRSTPSSRRKSAARRSRRPVVGHPVLIERARLPGAHMSHHTPTPEAAN